MILRNRGSKHIKIVILKQAKRTYTVEELPPGWEKLF